MPFVDLLEQVPAYAKYLKNMLKKKKPQTAKEIKLTEQCSAVLTSDIPPKLGDPGHFSVLCNIGWKNREFRGLCDLGSSVNIMPFAIFKQLNIGRLQPTNKILYLANNQPIIPMGVCENVLVKVEDFVYPCDFIILDMNIDREIPLLFGRNFLNTMQTVINVPLGIITIRMGNDWKHIRVFEGALGERGCYITKEDHYDLEEEQPRPIDTPPPSDYEITVEVNNLPPPKKSMRWTTKLQWRPKESKQEKKKKKKKAKEAGKQQSGGDRPPGWPPKK